MRIQMRLLALGVALATGSVPAAAQTTDAGYWDALTPSMASVAKTMHATVRRNLAEAAAAMPDAEYAFKPTPEVRTFAQLIGHVINANYFFCAQANGEKSPGTQDYEKLNVKASLVKALDAALAYCDSVVNGTSDASFTTLVKLAPPAKEQTPRGMVLMFNTTRSITATSLSTCA